MDKVPVFVGLDYHRLSVQVCVVDEAGKVLVNRRCGNSVAEVTVMLRPGWFVERAAIESCCGAAEFAEELIMEGWPVTLAHTGYVARMKYNPDKSDFSDARMLAELCRAGLIPPVWLAPEWVRELRVLVRLRADLAGRKRAVKTRILAVLRAQRKREPEGINRWTVKWLQWLEESGVSPDGLFLVRMHLSEIAHLQRQMEEVESRLRSRTADHPVVRRLCAIKWFGEIAAWTVLAMVGRVDRFTSGKQLARFCALTPRNASSGQRVADAGLVRAGDPLLKTVLIEAAHRLRRHDPRWMKFAERLEESGKPVSVVIAAIANRLVRWLYHQLKEIPVAA